ncbi:MAG: ABC transporter substrate-binding protein, partial [Firmicutes bacterium]|nr:ABC transporter substrate-binding protein [Bacillota bacterium]
KWWYTDGGTRLYMALNPKAMWSDGTPITTADVGLAIDFLASPTYNNTLSGNQGYRVLPIVGSQAEMEGQATTVSGFHVVSGQEFYVQLKKPDPSVVAADFQGIMPLPSEVLGNMPMAQWSASTFASEPSIGSGPFVMASREPGVLTMEANSRFVLGIPKLSGMQIKVVPPVAVPGLLRSGSVDLYTDLPLASLPRVSGVAGSTIVSSASNSLESLVWNDQGPEASNRLFRQAMLYAINRAGLVSQALSGQGDVANGPLPPDSQWYDTALDGAYAYAPQSARNLLIKAKYYIGDLDWLVQPDGRAMNVTIGYLQGDPTGAAVAQSIAADLRAIAINATAHGPYTEREMMDALNAPVNPKSTSLFGCVLGWSLGADPDPRGIWRSTDPFNKYLFQWDTTSDPTVIQSNDLIAEQVSATADTAATRKVLLNQWQTLISAAAPVDFLFTQDAMGVTSSRLTDVEWSGMKGPIDSWKWTLN